MSHTPEKPLNYVQMNRYQRLRARRDNETMPRVPQPKAFGAERKTLTELDILHSVANSLHALCTRLPTLANGDGPDEVIKERWIWRRLGSDLNLQFFESTVPAWQQSTVTAFHIRTVCSFCSTKIHR